MGNLRDQLLKAKLISEEQAHTAKREQRNQRTTQNLKAAEIEREEKTRAYKESQLKIADLDRQAARAGKEIEDAQFRQGRILQIIESGRLRMTLHGPEKFYFIASNGTIPCMDLSAQASEELRKGHAAIVEYEQAGIRRITVVTRPVAEILLKENPGMVRFFIRNETS